MSRGACLYISWKCVQNATLENKIPPEQAKYSCFASLSLHYSGSVKNPFFPRTPLYCYLCSTGKQANVSWLTTKHPRENCQVFHIMAYKQISTGDQYGQNVKFSPHSHGQFAAVTGANYGLTGPFSSYGTFDKLSSQLYFMRPIFR